ncbi:MAG: hypothetical protein EBZ91_15055 [Gammaproteobacteria bacterium]|nr:hypothetical protein [Gammaproteobacteria bacterium]
MHRDWSPSDVGHWREVWPVDLTDRNCSGDAVEDLEADGFVGRLGERLHLWEGDCAEVKGAFGGLRQANDPDAESEVPTLAILLHEAAALKG